MKRLLGRISCWWRGKHLRGKRVALRTADLPQITRLQCPRCGATWNRKQRKRNAE